MKKDTLKGGYLIDDDNANIECYDSSSLINYELAKHNDSNLYNFKNYKENILEKVSKIDNDMNLHEIYAILKSIIDDSNELKNSISKKDNIPYYNICANIMMEDISEYINRYIENYRPDIFKYVWISIARCRNSKKISLNYDRKHNLNMRGLGKVVSEFPKYTIFYILQIPIDSMLTEYDYIRFLSIKSSNQNYFLPYIMDIITCIDDIEEV